MADQMKFSVLMSVYDKEVPCWLSACLSSLAEQSKQPDEIILVEDGRLPDTLLEVIDNFRSRLNIISVRLPTNGGLAAALNEGLKHCNFDLVARMDSDDIAVPDRFERQIEFMQRFPEISILGGRISEFSGDDAGLGKVILCPTDHEEIFEAARFRNPVFHPTVIFRKADVSEVGGYPLTKNSQDYALWSLLLRKGVRFSNLSEVLVYMRGGVGLAKRRGFKYFTGEVSVLLFQYRIGFIGFGRFLVNFIFRFCLRAVPLQVRSVLYSFRGRYRG